MFTLRPGIFQGQPAATGTMTKVRCAGSALGRYVEGLLADPLLPFDSKSAQPGSRHPF